MSSTPASAPQRKPIYDEPSPAVVLVPAAPSALQLEVGRARQFVHSRFAAATGSTHEAVDRVLGAERRVERRFKSLKAPDEDLTPNGIYVLVATLAGSIVGHRRILPVRLLLPPLAAVLSARWLLPKSSANVADALSTIERERFPALASAHASADEWARSTWSSAAHTLRGWQRTGVSALESGADKVERTTGLQLHQALADAKRER